jgi:hypothetical protein
MIGPGESMADIIEFIRENAPSGDRDIVSSCQ